ncbi:MAG: purine-nucleoside phosphorylase [Candidatus Krumholzibacteria bacterium]|nr:purine-nucleoside phosphorylase [Candidatus Krumholzibacteria bacterium]
MRGAAACAIVLGSGLSKLALGLESIACVPYERIPGFGRTSVAGHPGFVSLCRLAGAPVLLFAGRFHAYERAGADTLASPVSLAKYAGCSSIIVTQAAGSLARRIPIRTWMLATDVIAFPSRSGLRFNREPFGGPPRGAERSRTAPVVSKGLSATLRSAARAAGIALAEGVLCWTSGPTYETAAEARAAAFMGADAATMSSLPELIAARRFGIEAACMSWITNYTAAVSENRTVHAEVLESGNEGARSLGAIVAGLLRARGIAR